MENRQALRACDRAICAIARGDRAALAVVYDHLARQVFSLAFTVTENHADAEDVLQDTMLAVCEHAQTYRPGSNARAWVLAIARNRARDLVRARRPDAPEQTLDGLTAPDGEAAAIEALALLQTLDEEDRQLVLLRLYAGLRYAELAEVTGLSVFAVQKRYQRALKKLRAQSEAGAPEQEGTT